MTTSRRHAVVLGAGWAGLVHAVALAGRFDKVTLVDRDLLSGEPRPRRGVSQAAHIHVLVPGGLTRLEQLLPGVTEELAAAGAHLVDSRDWRFQMGGGRLDLARAGFRITGATRPLLESVVRARVLALDGVELLDGWSAEQLETTADRARVTGVRLQSAHDPHEERTLDADLVLDTTGRGSRSPRWLEELGYGRVEEERLKVDLHYTTRLFRRDPADLGGCGNVLVDVPPDGTRGGAASAVEGGRWLVSLIGMAGERPPADLDGFVAYAGTLWAPDVHELVRAAQPLGTAQQRAFPASCWRRYDRLPRLPAGYAVSGDAVSSFNPRFGQGMTVALMEATELGRVLDEGPTEDAGSRLLAAARWVVQDAWDMATGSDLANRRVQGPRPLPWRVTNAYMRRLLNAAHEDPVVAAGFIRAVGMMDRPSELMQPRTLVRVLRPRGQGRSEQPGTDLRDGSGHPARRERAAR